MRATYIKINTPEDHSLHRECIQTKQFDAPWHFHPELELTLIVSSRGLRYVGDSIEAFREGDLVLLGPNVPHFWKNDDQARGKNRAMASAIVIQFHEDFLGRDLWLTPEFHKIPRLLRMATRGLKYGGATQRKVAALMQRMTRLRGTRCLIDFLLILDILADSNQATPLSSPGFMPTPDLFDAERINKVHSYVYAHLEEPIYQPLVAAHVHMRPASFSRFFRQKTGRTFSAFVNEVRIGHAARLLAEEKMNITEVCYACGFENLSNFNRRFRAIKKMTPRDFVAYHTDISR